MLVAQIPPAIVGITMAWFITSGEWNLVGIWVEPSVTGWTTGFADLAYITATADCLRDGSALATCDPYGRPFTPYSILPGSVLSVVGIGLQQTGALGVVLALVWVSLIGFVTNWLARRWQRGTALFAAALTSITVTGIAPTSLLAVERGTIDIAITATAGLGLLLMVHQPAIPHTLATGAREFFASAVLFIASIVKYFAVGLYAAFAAPRRWSLLPLISAAAAVMFLVINFGDLLIAREVSKSDLPSTTRILFSSTTGLVTVLTEDPYAFFPPEDQEIDMLSLRVIGALIVAVLAGISLVLLSRIRTSIPEASWMLIVGGGFILVIPYFLGDSNDYRLIGLILPLAGLLRWIAGDRSESRLNFLWIPVVLVVVTMLTGSSMIANEHGFILPKSAIVSGDLALAGVIGFVIAVWIDGWVRKPADSAAADR